MNILEQLTKLNQSSLCQFSPRPVVNCHEESVQEIIEISIGIEKFRYSHQVALRSICQRNGFIDDEKIFKFYSNSSVDIVILKKGGYGLKLPLLVIECQSSFHDNDDAIARDLLKKDILTESGIPLVSVRALDTRYYHFYQDFNSAGVVYNSITRDELPEVKNYLLKSMEIYE